MRSHHRSSVLAVCLVILSAGRSRADQPAAAPSADGPVPSLVGDDSVAAALRRFEAEQARERSGLLHLPGITIRELAVAGPSPGGRSLPGQVGQAPAGRGEPGPLSAELRTRVRHLDVAAGVRAEQRETAFEPAEWSGRLGVASEHESGREAFELRTSLAGREAGNVLGIEVGPRFERRLRRGATFFIDGRAAAEAPRPEQGWWSLPGAAGDGSTTVGVTARTGITR